MQLSLYLVPQLTRVSEIFIKKKRRFGNFLKSPAANRRRNVLTWLLLVGMMELLCCNGRRMKKKNYNMLVAY